MAMLAEPRQRKRYNLVPRGKALYEDDSRFGTKMLEKMGWSKGKGLGAKEEGAQDFVRVRYKNDAEGFGYEQRDDQWTQHEHGFNGLLKSLNGEEVPVDKDDSIKASEQRDNPEDDLPRVGFGFQDASVREDGKNKSDKPLKLKEKISGISLEEKSKQSKARVHYKKFTRGKDLSQYSEKDLLNIFGKKIEDEQQIAVNDLYQQLNNTFNSKPEANETNNDEEDANEKLNGVQLITTGVSVSDYFKKKMDEIQNRRNGHNKLENKLEQESSTEVQKDETTKNKKKKKEKKVRDFEKENEKNKMEKEEPNTTMFNSEVSVADYFKNKMEEMKKRQKAKNITENVMEQQIAIDVQEDIGKKKKKHKKENKDQKETNELNINEEQFTIKTKKSKKLDTVKIDEGIYDENEKLLVNKNGRNEVMKEMVEKERKKRKNEVDCSLEFIHDIDLTQEPEKKKKKKNKAIDPLETIAVKRTAQKEETISQDQKPLADSVLEFVHEIDLTQEPEKKKKKKNKDTLEVNDTPQEIAQKVETIRKNETNSNNSLLETVHEIDLTQEPEKKKMKKNKTKDPIKVNDTPQEMEKIPRDQPNSFGKKKLKSKQKLNSSGKQLSINQINGSISDVKKLKKSKSKDVSATTIQKYTNDIKSLTLDDIKNKYNSFNIYQISSFCAEKFRNINLNHFLGSTLPQVDGYAFSQDMQLDVRIIQNDEERITNLWKNTLDKYSQLEKPKKTYKNYIKEVIKARKTKQKRPILHVKTWKRKNAFQTI